MSGFFPAGTGIAVASPMRCINILMGMRKGLLGSTLLLAGAAQADVVLRNGELVAFKRIDSDRNGYVSRVEARSVRPVETRFDWADANKDGLLDEEEYVLLRKRRPHE